MDSRKIGYACPRCTVGRCTPQNTTFADVFQGQLLTIPNVLAHICDVCHFAEFDRELLEGLWAELYGELPLDDIQTVARAESSSSYGEESS